MNDLLPAKQSAMPVSEAAYQPYPPADDYSAPASSARLRRILTFLAKYWWIPLLTTLLGVAAAVGVAVVLPPTYVSTGRLYESEKLRLTEGAAFTEDFQNYYGTQIALLQSDRMMALALESLQASGYRSIPRDNDGKPMVTVKARQLPRSSFLVVTTSSKDSEFAQKSLDALMSAFQVYRREIRQSVGGTTYSSIADQVKRLEAELRADQKVLVDFQQTNNLDILQAEGTVSGSHLARLQTQLSELKLEKQLLEAAASDQEGGSSSGTNAAPYLLDSVRSGGFAAGGATGDRQTAFKELELLKAQRAKLSKYLKPRHPKIVRLDVDIERGEQLAELYRNQTREQLASARQAINMRIDSIEASMKEWEGKVVDYKKLIVEAERLRQKAASSQSLFDRLVRLKDNVDLTRNINQDSLTILEQASPAKRSHIQEISIVGVGSMLGLLLGLGIVLLVEIRDDRFISLHEVTDKFGDSIVGQVPEVRELRKKNASLLLEQNCEPPLLAESYRSLRSALLYLPMEAERPRVVVITSALPAEGKSTIAANLAKTVAMGGARVLLVDGDLRKGRLHRVLGLNSEPGLADLLRSPSRMNEIVQSNGVNNLSFIAKGKDSSHPGDLLVGRPLDELIARWRVEYDFVVIDSCPVLAADDVTTLAPKADGTVVVVRRRHASARVVREALELLAQRQARILGLVFNRADASAPSYNYYKYAEYYR